MPADLTPASALTEVRLLGRPCWRFAGAESFKELALRDASLLAMLALDGAIPRDRTAAWLWPEVAQANANLSLRQRIFRLRRQSGQLLIDAGQVLRLAPGVSVDVQADPLPSDGKLLAGLDFGASEAFDDWLQGARRSIARRQTDQLAGQAALCEARGDLAAAVALCERIVANDPQTEHTWRRLMRLHWLRADRAAAIAAFERFEQQVCREQGIRPSAETLDLLEQVERLEASARSSTATTLPPSLLRPPLLVGRDAALQAMDTAWTAGRALLLLAAGGMGKSRLLEAFSHARPGLLQVRARPGDAAQPFDTLAHALAEAIDRYAPQLAASTRLELARILPGLGRAPHSPAQGSRLRHAIEQAWLACMRNGLSALLIDDLHWADTTSLEQLHWQLASPALADLRCAFAARPDEATPATPVLRDWLGDSSRVVPIELPSWCEAELQTLLDSLALTAASTQDAGLAARLLRQTGGQPFFVLETLKALCLPEGQLDTAGVPAPAPAVSAVIERRLQRLPDTARQLLQVLAVADGDLRLEAATQVLRRPLLALAADWSELASAQLVRHTGVAHDLVRECVLAGLPEPARRALHHALAEALAGMPGIPPAKLARHWQAAQAWPQTASTWLAAARLAVGAGRLAEADDLFTRAANACERADDPAQLAAVLAAAQPSRLLCLGADEVAGRLREHLEKTRARAPRVRLLLLQAEAELARMKFDSAAAAAAQASALAQDLPGEAELKADTNLLHGRTLAWTEGSEEGLARMRLACAEIDALGDLRRRLHARATLSDVLVPLGRRLESASNQREALLLARQLGDAFEVAVCSANLALYDFMIGNAEEAYTAAAEALQAFAQMGADHVNRLMCTAVFCYAAAHRGRFDEVAAETTALVARENSDAASDPVMRNLLNVLSTIALWRGRLDEAARLLPPESDDAPWSVRLTGLQARLRWLSWSGAEEAEFAGPLQALQAIGEANPQLRDDAHYYRGWAPFDPPDQAVPRLDQLADREWQAGAHALARSLKLIALQLALAGDAAGAGRRARDLLDQLPLGIHPSIYLPEAWWTVAEGLRMVGDQQGRRTALLKARDWIDQVQLPEAEDDAATAFREGNPVNRRVLAAAASLGLQ